MPDPVKFLLVDDLEENLRALEALLRRDGLSIYKACSGNEALELLLQHDFSLAFLDVQMPDMDGFELAELMRGTERTCHVPIVFITAAAADEGRRFRGYEAGAVDYVFKPVDSLIVRSKAKVFFDIGQQRQELARQRNELEATASKLKDALDRLQAHTDNSPMAIVEFNPDLQILSWSKGAERMFGWTARDMVGRALAELGWLPEDDLRHVMTHLADEMSDEAHTRGLDVVSVTRKDGALIDCEWYGSVLRDVRNRPISLNVQILDVTERRRAVETQRLLIGELNHRVKNTLANVQAIATQTLRHTRNPEQFSATFSGRIQSLARAHAMLSATTWQGAKLGELIRDQLRLGTIDGARFSMSGPEVELPPQAALRLALVFHELSTNANKYGALASSAGRVDLTWTIEDAQLAISWKESGGPAVKAPARRGFGTTLVEQSVKADGGNASVSYSADGVLWNLTLTLPDADSSETATQAPDINPYSKQPSAAADSEVRGKTYLIVEDEALVGLDLVCVLEDAGAVAVGPAGTVEDALKLIESTEFDAAFLDGNLHGKPVDDVAAMLTRRNIPFAFVSGYGRENLPSAFGSISVVGKPFTPKELLETAAMLTAQRDDVIKLRS
ncbi:MAG: response regulator [Mesorhizobium sp.]